MNRLTSVRSAAALALCAAAFSLSACDSTDPPPDPPALVFGRCIDGVALDTDTTAYPCRQIGLAAHLTPQQLGVTPVGGVFHNSIWGWADPATGREYAVVGNADGTRFVDVTVPTAPVYLGRLPSATANSLWREVRVTGTLAVIVSEAPGHGLQVFDLTGLRGLTADPTRLFTATGRYTGFGSAHNVVVTEGPGARPVVYGVGARQGVAAGLPAACNAPGFHAVDLATPSAPAFAGCFSDVDRDARPVAGRGYTHDAQCLTYRGPDADYAGRQICLASNEDVVTVFDVTDLAAVRIVSQAAYPGSAYTHQGALTQDSRYFLVDDELDEQNGLAATASTIVLDLLDLDAPEFAFRYASALPVIDHNQYVRGGLVFQSNYEAGLRVLDVTGVAAGTLTEVAFFDTYPQGQAVSFDGQWANYPYLPSGTLLANDIQNGLFVLTPDATLNR